LKEHGITKVDLELVLSHTDFTREVAIQKLKQSNCDSVKVMLEAIQSGNIPKKPNKQTDLNNQIHQLIKNKQLSKEQ